ncbi:hypothetical protein MVES1_001707 [Malassezia vespertilionis]|uniref:Maf1p n=1 Tax=Malassezia vespertilionis TaxID=2020962 RepID=A0A2N1JCY0_9BASI|nr:uncharacterized protein MVES1_001707 [Malassezia vespertilionis]PKI84387.1 hypothetical protein MVES_001606 [Malassezia vespertilionis]WFD06362.1 hypothetical protein MVES1_001707 [Malassezia vespertilionis]
MKYLEYPELEVLSRALTFEMAECKVFTRLEAYSCKAVNKEKRLFKSLESSYLLSASTSPSAYLDEALASPFGRLDQPAARKTLFLLIATLNGAFPDHDFSDVNPTDFTRESSPDMVLNSLASTLQSLRSGTGSPHSFGSFNSALEESVLLARSPIHAAATLGAYTSTGTARSTNATMSVVLDEIINIAECEVYSFHPDMDSDPHASAEPDEEGLDVADDPYNEGDEVHAQRTHSADEAQLTDTPMFDEDVDAGGFGGADAMHAPTHPQTSQEPSPALTVDEDDLGGAGAGLLWSTFAFFYNRRMKRILFVSVWSRKNSAHNTIWSPSSGPVRSTPLSAIRPLDLGAAHTIAPHVRVERPGEHLLTPTASPHKMHARRRSEARPAPYVMTQIQRTRRAARGRSASNSPAPSAMSPFPHAQASAAQPHEDMPSFVHSTSAPSTQRFTFGASPPAVKRTGEMHGGPLDAVTKRSRAAMFPHDAQS